MKARGATAATKASFWKSSKMATGIERKDPKYLVLGEILRPHGIKGEVRMRIVTDYPERLPELDSVYIGKSADDKHIARHSLKQVRFNKSYALLTLEGYSSRSDSDRLRNKVVMVDIDDTAPLEDGEYYLFQLIGLQVVADRQDIGQVKEVLQTGANDVYVVESEKYGEVLIPAHAETITKIDFAAETITMSLPEGLLPPT